uniref:Uncharacterized protein n=1 Tax=Salmo trutta TaxID=8032 RepID=A0A673WTL6_SALTR
MSVCVCVLLDVPVPWAASPFLHWFSSASSLWTVSFITLFFSFSFPYFFFHCSAVSSKFTEAVFLMVLALGGERRDIIQSIPHNNNNYI